MEGQVGLLDKLFKKTTVHAEVLSSSAEEAVLIELKGSGLPQTTYDQYDVSGLEEELASALDGSSVGELDGHEFTSNGVTVYLYGSNSEALFKRIESVLRSYPLCEQACVTIRQGNPGAPQRIVQL